MECNKLKIYLFEECGKGVVQNVFSFVGFLKNASTEEFPQCPEVLGKSLCFLLLPTSLDSAILNVVHKLLVVITDTYKLPVITNTVLLPASVLVFSLLEWIF